MAIIVSVEDNPVNQLLVVQRMKMLGHDVIEAETGEAALSIIQNTPDIALILLDIGLPKMDGIELAQQLKNNKSTQQIPIIFLTAHATVDYKDKAAQLGILDFYTKPLDFKALSIRIIEILTKSEA